MQEAEGLCEISHLSWFHSEQTGTRLKEHTGQTRAQEGSPRVSIDPPISSDPPLSFSATRLCRRLSRLAAGQPNLRCCAPSFVRMTGGHLRDLASYPTPQSPAQVDAEPSATSRHPAISRLAEGQLMPGQPTAPHSHSYTSTEAAQPLENPAGALLVEKRARPGPSRFPSPLLTLVVPAHPEQSLPARH